MVTETEKTLIQSLVALGLKKETTTAIIQVLTTKAQQGTMLDWIYKHYKENPTKTEIIQIVEAIKEQVK